MAEQPVRYEVVDSVAWLTINRPEARNALNNAVRTGLFDAVRRFNDDDAAKVLVLTGVGDKAFCAGGDLKEMAQNALKVPRRTSLRSSAATSMSRSRRSRPSTVSRSPGASCSRSLCDLVVAAEHATFAVSEVKVGRGSPWAAPLSWLVPPRVAMQILLTGDPITAERAHQVGLVNEVVPADQLRERTRQLALSIAANAPLSVLASKRTVYLSAQHHLAAAYDLADEIWEPVYLSDDAQEGPTAFREKRAPQWKGR